jgi:hypothetical protein
MSNPISSQQTVIAQQVSVNNGTIFASGASGLVDATTVKATNLIAASLSISGLSTATVTTNVLTANVASIASVSANAIGSNTVTLGGQLALTATAQGLVQTATPFAPITQSGIRSIKVQGAGEAFGGKSFADMAGTADAIGKYSYILATANAYVNRNDPQASRIRDVEYARHDATGNVNYDFDLVILYPTDPSKYSGNVVVEPVNRGLAALVTLGDVGLLPSFGKPLTGNVVPNISSSGVPTVGTGSGNEFLYRQGDMFVFVANEGIRPQVLTDFMCATFATNVITDSVTWPGQSLLSPLTLGLDPFRTTVGLGMTLPTCYYDPGAATPSHLVTGDCTDYTVFSTFTTNTFPISSSDTANVTIYNSFPMYYPFMPDTGITVSLSYGYNGTPIPLASNLFYVTNGFGTVSPGINFLNVGDLTAGFGGMAIPAQYNQAYCTIDRQSILKGLNGQPMTTSNVANWNQYAAVLEADSTGTLRDSGSSYTINYTGFQAKPLALAALGMRDLVSYLRYGSTSVFTGLSAGTDFWTGYTGNTARTMCFAQSSSAVFMKGFLYDGYNVSSNVSGGINQPVFDGILNVYGFTRKEQFNRFAKQNEVTAASRYQNNDTAADFPFAYSTTTDPYSGRTDGLLYKYLTTYPACVPKIYDTSSEFEMAIASMNLLISDPLGIPISNTVYENYLGLYFITGSDHAFFPITQPNGPGQFPGINPFTGLPTGAYLDYANLFLVDDTVEGFPGSPIVQPISPVASTYAYRSLYYNMKRWISNPSAANPLPSKFPKLGTLTANVQPLGTMWTSSNAQLQSIKSTFTEMGIPDVSNIVTLGVKFSTGGTFAYNTNGFPPELDRLKITGSNYYRQFIRGTNSDYQVYGPILDYPYRIPVLGNNGLVSIGGIPTPETAAPLFSSSGSNRYQPGYGVKGDLFPNITTAVISLASNNVVRDYVFQNDPRPSITQLYTNVATWSNTWNVAVANNITNGYMLNSTIFPYDETQYLNRGLFQSNLLASVWNIPLV